MNKNNNIIEVHLDMDGVLADFDEKIESQSDLAQIRESLKQMSANFKQKLNNNQDFHWKDLEMFLRGPQSDPDLHRLKRRLKEGKEKIFSYASQEGFFVSLKKMPDADELFAGVEKLLNGNKPNILTAPLVSNPTCVQEKKLWIDSHFAGRYDKFRAEKNKQNFAHSRSILIDDTPKKVRAFVEAGGIGILHTNAKDSLAELEDIFQNKFGKNVSL